MYDLKLKDQVFKATFKDATDKIVKLFYISDFEDQIDYDEAHEMEDNKFLDDEIVGYDDNIGRKPKVFKGYFLLVENKVSRPQGSGM